MNENLLNTIFNLLLILGIVIVIFGIWFVVWSMIRHPIRMKDAILKERDEARKELLEIQAAKGVEWDQYKKLEEDIDRLRKSYYQTKANLDNVKEELAKETVIKEKLIAKNRELAKEIKDEKKTDET